MLSLLHLKILLNLLLLKSVNSTLNLNLRQQKSTLRWINSLVLKQVEVKKVDLSLKANHIQDLNLKHIVNQKNLVVRERNLDQALKRKVAQRSIVVQKRKVNLNLRNTVGLDQKKRVKVDLTSRVDLELRNKVVLKNIVALEVVQELVLDIKRVALVENLNLTYPRQKVVLLFSKL